MVAVDTDYDDYSGWFWSTSAKPKEPEETEPEWFGWKMSDKPENLEELIELVKKSVFLQAVCVLTGYYVFSAVFMSLQPLLLVGAACSIAYQLAGIRAALDKIASAKAR